MQWWGLLAFSLLVIRILWLIFKLTFIIWLMELMGYTCRKLLLEMDLYSLCLLMALLYFILKFHIAPLAIFMIGFRFYVYNVLLWIIVYNVHLTIIVQCVKWVFMLIPQIYVKLFYVIFLNVRCVWMFHSVINAISLIRIFSMKQTEFANFAT